MAENLYMHWGADWGYTDTMDNISATGWNIGTGGAVTQLNDSVIISQSAGTDQIYKPFPDKAFPMTVDVTLSSYGQHNSFRIGDGNNLIYVKFPHTDDSIRHYRIIIRRISILPGAIQLYENGRLVKNKADIVEAGTFNSLYFYVTGDAVPGDNLRIYNYKHRFGHDFGAPTLAEIQADTIYLDGRDGYQLMFHRVGARMPPRNFVTDQIPLEDGVIKRHTQVIERDISLGILVAGSTPSDLNEKQRRIEKAFHYDGKLYAKMSDGYRYLAASYVEGLEGEETPDYTNGYIQKSIAKFRAFDPYWVASSQQNIQISPGSNISAYTMFINNPGDVPVYPEFYIVGPCRFGSLINQTTGQYCDFDINLPTANDFIYIRTQPGERTIQDKNQNVIWSSYQYGDLFPLGPGENQITVDFLSGTATTAATTIICNFNPRYLGV